MRDQLRRGRRRASSRSRSAAARRADELLAGACRGAGEVRAGVDRSLGKASRSFGAATIDTTHGVLPARPFRPRRRAATATPARRSSRTWTISSRRWSTISTCALLAPPKGGSSTADQGDPHRRRRPSPTPGRVISPLGVRRGPTTPADRRHPARQGGVGPGLDRRKRAAGMLTYDDLLTRLRPLARPGARPGAGRKLRDRYQVVLVDEFQDTDPVQWDVVHRAFGDGRTTLVLIGDPKQAIYAFRGADVYAYLDAAAAASAKATLARQLAQRPGADRRLRRHRRRRTARPPGHRPSQGASASSAEPAARASPARRAAPRCGSGSSSGERGADDHGRRAQVPERSPPLAPPTPARSITPTSAQTSIAATPGATRAERPAPRRPAT